MKMVFAESPLMSPLIYDIKADIVGILYAKILGLAITLIR